MSNSSLVSYSKLSPNHSGKRTHTIDRITPHCVVGQCSVEWLGDLFAKESRQASSNYGIGSDGRIALYVDECNRSWCSSSNENDQRAVTIECASDDKPPYAFKSIVFEKLIELCVDICKRNGKRRLKWIKDRNTAVNYQPTEDTMLLTIHKWFANTDCPGQWLCDRLAILATEVTNRLTQEHEKHYIYRVQVGAYSIAENASNRKQLMEDMGYVAFVRKENNLYKVQVGAFEVLQNAINLQYELKKKGISSFIQTREE